MSLLVSMLLTSLIQDRVPLGEDASEKRSELDTKGLIANVNDRVVQVGIPPSVEVCAEYSSL